MARSAVDLRLPVVRLLARAAAAAAEAFGGWAPPEVGTWAVKRAAEEMGVGASPADTCAPLLCVCELAAAAGMRAWGRTWALAERVLLPDDLSLEWGASRELCQL